MMEELPFGNRQNEVQRAIVRMKSHDVHERASEAYHLDVSFSGHQDAIAITLRLASKAAPAFKSKPLHLRCTSETCSEYLRALIGIGVTQNLLYQEDGGVMMAGAQIIKHTPPPPEKKKRTRGTRHTPLVEKPLATPPEPLALEAPPVVPQPAPPLEEPPQAAAPEAKPEPARLPPDTVPADHMPSLAISHVATAELMQPAKRSSVTVPTPIVLPSMDPLEDFKKHAKSLRYGSRILSISVTPLYDTSADASIRVAYKNPQGAQDSFSSHAYDVMEPAFRKSDPRLPKKAIVAEIASALSRATGHPSRDLRQMMETPALGGGIGKWQ